MNQVNKIITFSSCHSCKAISKVSSYTYSTYTTNISHVNLGKELYKTHSAKITDRSRNLFSSSCIKKKLWLGYVKRPAINCNDEILNTTNSKLNCVTKLSSHQIRNFNVNDKSHIALPILTLYTKDPCPLCDEALEQLRPLLYQVNLQKVDITAPGNEDLWKAYRFDIPVFHLNGKFIMKHKADLSAFKTALKEYYCPNK